MTAPHVFSPQMLAERWGVTDKTVRNLIARGELRGFRFGKVYRVSREAVEEYECKSLNGPLDATGESSFSSTKTPAASERVVRLEPATRARLDRLRQQSTPS